MNSDESIEKYQIPAGPREDLNDVFKLFDEKNEGLISVKNMKLVLHGMGFVLPDAKLQQLIEELDPALKQESNATDEQMIDFERFNNIMSCLMSKVEQNANDVIEAYKLIDKNNDGYICEADLRQTALDLGYVLTDDDLEDMLKELDVNDSGNVDYDGFAKIMLSK